MSDSSWAIHLDMEELAYLRAAFPSIHERFREQSVKHVRHTSKRYRELFHTSVCRLATCVYSHYHCCTGTFLTTVSASISLRMHERQFSKIAWARWKLSHTKWVHISNVFHDHMMYPPRNMTHQTSYMHDAGIPQANLNGCPCLDQQESMSEVSSCLWWHLRTTLCAHRLYNFPRPPSMAARNWKARFQIITFLSTKWEQRTEMQSKIWNLYLCWNIRRHADTRRPWLSTGPCCDRRSVRSKAHMAKRPRPVHERDGGSDSEADLISLLAKAHDEGRKLFPCSCMLQGGCHSDPCCDTQDRQPSPRRYSHF